MRILLASAAVAAFAITATPAFAQYGGSPTEQVEGAPAEADEAPAPEDQVLTPEEEQALPVFGAGDTLAPDVDPDADVDVATEQDADGGVAGGGKPGVEGEEYALADVDADTDADMDADMDADQGDAEADEAGEMAPGEAYENEDAAPEEGGVSGGGYQSADPRDEDGQATCRRSDGTTGLVVGGGAGALVGREIGRDGRHYRRRGRGGGGTAGAIIGGLIGAVVGSAIERGASEQNCR